MDFENDSMGKNLLASFVTKNDEHLAESLFLHWESRRRDLESELLYNLVDQLICVNQLADGIADARLLYIQRWHERRPRHCEVRSVDTTNRISSLCLEHLPSDMPIDYITSQPVSIFDMQYTPTIILPIDLIYSTEVQAPWSLCETNDYSTILGQVFPTNGIETMKDIEWAVHKTEIPWYCNVFLLRLVELLGKKRILYRLWYENQLFPLEGTSNSIHVINKITEMRLVEETVLDYLRFFNFFTQSEDGYPFYILEGEEDDMLPDSATESDILVIKEHAFKARLNGRNNRGDYVCEVLLYFSNNLYLSTFVVSEIGEVELVDDEPLAELSTSIKYPLS